MLLHTHSTAGLPGLLSPPALPYSLIDVSKRKKLLLMTAETTGSSQGDIAILGMTTHQCFDTGTKGQQKKATGVPGKAFEVYQDEVKGNRQGASGPAKKTKPAAGAVILAIILPWSAVLLIVRYTIPALVFALSCADNLT